MSIDLLQQIATIISTCQQIFTQMNLKGFLMVKGRRIEMTKKEVIIVGALFWQRLKECWAPKKPLTFTEALRMFSLKVERRARCLG